MSREVIKRPIDRVGIVIVAFNDPTSLDTCLRSIAVQEGEEVARAVVVVDNSTDDAVRSLMARRHHGTRVVPSPNRGYGAGNNRGASITSSEIILFLNPDTELAQPILGEIAVAFDTDPSLGALGMQLRYPSGQPQQSFFWAVPGGVCKSLLQHAATRFGFFQARRMCTSGAAMAVRRSAFIEVGLFDEDFFLYCEELDLWQRLTKAGWRWGFRREISLVHVGGTSTPDPAIATERRLLSLRLYCEKYGISYRRQVRKELRHLRLVAAGKHALGFAKAKSRRSADPIIAVYARVLAGVAKEDI